MKYPSQEDVAAFAEASGPNGIASASLHFGITWEETDQIARYGHVRPDTARYWGMVRRETVEDARDE